MSISESEAIPVKHKQLESFNLDHTKIVAPYVRHSKTMAVPDSKYEINVYDFRLKTPNIVLLTPPTIHTLEHLLATAIRTVFPKKCPGCKVIDLSPMGCRTGFYVTILSPVGGLNLQQVTDAIRTLIPEAYAIEELPGATIETCGGYLEHNFEDAKHELELLMGQELVALHDPPFLNQ